MKKTLQLIWLLLVLPATAIAQTGTLTGSIIDNSTSSPIPGAYIVLSETALGAASTAEGTYTIRNIPTGTYTLQASSNSYKYAEIEVTIFEGHNQFNVILTPHGAEPELVIPAEYTEVLLEHEHEPSPNYLPKLQEFCDPNPLLESPPLP